MLASAWAPGLVAFAIVLVSGFAMKATTWFRLRGEVSTLFLLSAAPSLRTWRGSETISKPRLRRLILEFSFSFLILVFSVEIYFRVTQFFINPWLELYLASLPFFCVTLFLSSLLRLLSLGSGRIPPSVHRNVFLSRSLSDFWGHRWNRYVHEWFFENIFWPLKRVPVVAGASVFFVSGLWHELLINGAWWIVHGEWFFGNMLLFFMAQFGGVLLSRRWIPALLLRWPVGLKLAQRLFFWIFLALTLPLFMSDVTLGLLLLK